MTAHHPSPNPKPSPLTHSVNSPNSLVSVLKPFLPCCVKNPDHIRATI